MKTKTTSLQGYLLISPLLIGCLLFYAIPFVLVVQYSLSAGSGGASDFIGLINYQDVTANRMFSLAFGNTMRFLAAALPLIMALAYSIALLMPDGPFRLAFTNGLMSESTALWFASILVQNKKGGVC